MPPVLHRFLWTGWLKFGFTKSKQMCYQTDDWWWNARVVTLVWHNDSLILIPRNGSHLFEFRALATSARKSKISLKNEHLHRYTLYFIVTAVVYGGKFKFAVATIWWVMVSLSVLIGWIWRHLLESDRLPFPTVSSLLPEKLSGVSCDFSLILEPATMMKEAWDSKVCI